MITVGIVEDDRDVRESLALLINGVSGYACVGHYGSCEAGVPALLAAPPDVVLMDIGLPGRSGIEAIRDLKAALPALDVVVLTIHENDAVVFEALCAGACGYLLKDEGPERLLEAIHDVHHGGAPMSTQIARLVVGSFQQAPPVPSPLTPRETEVLHELCRGKSYKMIADALCISEETVRRHLKSIYRKLEVHSKSEAVAKAYETRLVRGVR